MLYPLLRALSAVALRWFYSRVDAEGVERIPERGPTILVVNHPNAMVDAMVTALISPRRILFTGRATLFANPLFGAEDGWAPGVLVSSPTLNQAIAWQTPRRYEIGIRFEF